MWTCWSLSTFTDQEYTHGITNPAYFNVTGCDPDQWADTAKQRRSSRSAPAIRHRPRDFLPNQAATAKDEGATYCYACAFAGSTCPSRQAR